MGAAFFMLTNCSASEEPNPDVIEINKDTIPDGNPTSGFDLDILSLGDSYTIGESVCSTCRFPEQLKDSLIKNASLKEAGLKVIARTGWTTTNLKDAIAQENLDTNYDLVTLLIGVNNQFQGKPFSLFEKEFPELIGEAIKYAQSKKENLIVVSIPDYAFTPFGGGSTRISEGINQYNAFIESYCRENNITYIFITDITRLGIEQPDLVATDGLHPSTLAYGKFVSRMLPSALEKIGVQTD